MHDERMKEIIPSIMESISAFFSPILNTMYSIQSDLYQHLYASVYEYATSQGLTDTENVVEECTALYDPIRQRAETEIKSLREGKTSRTPIGESSSKPGLFGRKSSTSSTSILRPTKPTSPPAYSPNPTISPNPTKAPPPGPSPVLGRQNENRTMSSSSVNSEKKRPPPPPPKPSVSPKPDFVVARYDFAGESQGDLAFRAGDRIKIVKKTDSLEDWWEGELNGNRGMFPRNYCE
jgi:amphiphysin